MSEAKKPLPDADDPDTSPSVVTIKAEVTADWEFGPDERIQPRERSKKARQEVSAWREVTPAPSAGKTAGKGAAAAAEGDRWHFYFNVIDFVVALLDESAGAFRVHAHAVARYSRLLATKLGLPKDEIDEIVTAAYLHDFDRLLKGPGPNDTIALLEALEAPASLREIIHGSDEYYDGSGPNRLSGEAIPLGSRIVAVANRLDEVSRGRVDTQVTRRNDTLKALQERAGMQLDPNLVTMMVDALKNELHPTFRQHDARVLIIAGNDEQRFTLANQLLEFGFVPRTCSGVPEGVQALTGFFPHVVLISYPQFEALVQSCRDRDNYLQAPVVILGPKGMEREVKSNDYMVIEEFIGEPVNLKVLATKVERILDRVIRQEEKARETAGFFEKAGNFFKAADIYREIGDYRRAADMYGSSNAFMQAGEMFELIKDYRRAAAAFEKGGDFEKAAKYFGEVGAAEEQARALERTGDYYYVAKNRLFQQRYDEALVLFEKLEPSHPKFRKAAYFMGKIHMERRNFVEAIRYFERVIGGERVNSRNLRFYYNVAVAQEQLERNVEALEIFEKVLGVDYNFRDVYRRVDRLRRKQQQLEQQSKLQQKVTSFAPMAGAKTQAARYEKIRIVGRGGMGVVYEAKDSVLDRQVALKVLSAAFREDKLVVDTFLREAKAAAMLNHVNIVTIYDAGIEANNYFIAMELIQGKTLKEVLRQRQLSVASVLQVMRQVCRGLKYAHSKKIIHRDLTNSNVMLTTDNVIKIMDFGLARIVEHLMSEQSIIGGTPSYMAPEQVRGAPIDHRADIYALGVNLFELCTGRLPFIEGDLGYHHVHTTPPNPKELNPKLPNELETTILKCLEKEPENRFQNVAELMEALKI